MDIFKCNEGTLRSRIKKLMELKEIGYNQPNTARFSVFEQ